MAPKIITIVQRNGKERLISITDQPHLDSWLENILKVESLVWTEDAVEYGRFASLRDKGTYTLGPPVVEQQQEQRDTTRPDTRPSPAKTIKADLANKHF